MGDTLAQEATVRSLISKELAGDPGRELSMITIEYPPGSVDPVHTHRAQALVYVLEGTIEMQVKGGTAVTLTPGQTFYEEPEDVHVVGRNASQTAPAKFLVFLVKDKGAPPSDASELSRRRREDLRHRSDPHWRGHVDEVNGRCRASVTRRDRLARVPHLRNARPAGWPGARRLASR